MTTYKWNLVGILNEINELINVIMEVKDEIVQQQLISFLEDYRSMIVERKNADDTKEDRAISRQIKKKIRIYNTLRNIFISKKNRRSIENHPIFEHSDKIIKILVNILEIESVNKIENSLLTEVSYDELIDTVLEFLSGIDKSYQSLFYKCIENSMFEIRKSEKNADISGQSILIQNNNYIYINDTCGTPNYSLGPIVSHEVGHMIHDNANSNVEIIILEAISVTMEWLYIDLLPSELYVDEIVLKEKFFGEYLYYLFQLLTQISLKDNIVGILDERKVIYKNPFKNNKILQSNGIYASSHYTNGVFYQGEAYSIGFLIAFKIKELYEEDKEKAVYVLKKIISLDSNEQMIFEYLEELGIFEEEFVDKIVDYITQNGRAYRKLKE